MENDKQKMEKFLEFENSDSKDKEMISFEKAVWLTSRANYFGGKKMITESIEDSKEAIEIKNDYLPAYLSLAIACTIKNGNNFETGVNIIKKAPEVFVMGNEIILKKKDILKQFKEFADSATGSASL